MQNLVYNVGLKLESDKKSIRDVEPLLKDLRSILKLPDESYYNILIAITEAMNNAIIHGNKYRTDKSVSISIKANKTNPTARASAIIAIAM